MNYLDSLNVRKGLELGVEVVDIFKINTKPQGDVTAKEICDIGWDKYCLYNDISIDFILKTDGLIYSSPKEEIVISDTLIAYVFHSYVVNAESSEQIETPQVAFTSCVEIEFLNTETLNFNQFCQNIMAAQRFTGKYEVSKFKFSFYGHGNFTLDEYLYVHELITMSNIHCLNFFIIYKKVLSGIGSFVTGLYRNDIMRQREYLTLKELSALLDEAEQQFAMVSAILEQEDNL